MSGKITCEGVPVVTGTVMIMGVDGRAHHGPIQPDGQYLVRDVPVGSAQVSVISLNPAFVESAAKKTGMARNVAPVLWKEKRSQYTPQSPDKNGWFPIPEKYNNPVDSGLRCKVRRGGVVFDINLERQEEDRKPQK